MTTTVEQCSHRRPWSTCSWSYWLYTRGREDYLLTSGQKGQRSRLLLELQVLIVTLKSPFFVYKSWKYIYIFLTCELRTDLKWQWSCHQVLIQDENKVRLIYRETMGGGKDGGWDGGRDFNPGDDETNIIVSVIYVPWTSSSSQPWQQKCLF